MNWFAVGLVLGAGIQFVAARMLGDDQPKAIAFTVTERIVPAPCPKCEDYIGVYGRVFDRIRAELADGEWKGLPLVAGAATDVLREELSEAACLPLPTPYATSVWLDLSPTFCHDGGPARVEAWLGKDSAVRFTCEFDRFNHGENLVGKGERGRFEVLDGGGLEVSGSHAAIRGNGMGFTSSGDWLQWADYPSHNPPLAKATDFKRGTN